MRVLLAVLAAVLSLPGHAFPLLALARGQVCQVSEFSGALRVLMLSYLAGRYLRG
jgi:hypothetical protein